MSIVKTNKFQTLDGMTYNVPIQVVTSSLGAADLGTTLSATSDRTNYNASYTIASTTTTWTDTSHLQLTITPKFSNSMIKLGLCVYLNNTANNGAPGIRVIRGTKIVFRPALNTSGPFGVGYSGTGAQHSTYFFEFYDYPETTSPVTYRLQYRSYDGGSCRWFGHEGEHWSHANYFTATEIAQ